MLKLYYSGIIICNKIINNVFYYEEENVWLCEAYN